MIALILLIAVGMASSGVLVPEFHSDMGYQFQLNIGDLEITEYDGFSHVGIFGEVGATEDIGRPEIPVVRKIIKVPREGNIYVKIFNMQTRTISLDELGFPKWIYPVQPPIPKCGTPPPFTIDEEWYNTATYEVSKNEIVYVERVGTMRGRHLAMLGVNPVLYYNPRTGEIKHIVSATIEVSFDRPIDPVPRRLRSKYFDRIFSLFLLVPEDLPTEPDTPIVYWVIYHDPCSTALAPLLEWKRLMGYNVIATPVGAIGTTPAAIRDTIKDAYDHWPHAPDFVLLVGDVEQVPSNPGEASVSGGASSRHVTDLIYFTVDDTDYLPDIIYARFPAANCSQVQAIVEKTLYYEKYQITNPFWLAKPIFTACHSDPHCHICWESHRYVITHWLNRPRFQAESLYTRDGYTGSDVMDRVDSGVVLFNNCGHGNPNGIHEPNIVTSDVHSLTNAGKYPLVICGSCLTAKFDVPECFGEAWIRGRNKGSVGYIGSSDYAYWNVDEYWQRKLYDGLFADSFVTFMGAMFSASVHLMTAYTRYAHYYFEIQQFFGDPSLWLYWGIPEETLKVDLSEWSGVVPLGVPEYNIPVSHDDALVSFTRGEGRFGVGKSMGGYVSFTPEFIPDSAGSIWVVATKPNWYVPFIKKTYNEYLSIAYYSPESLRVGVDNVFNITIYNGDTVPFDTALVKITGFCLSESAYTDSLGHATMIVNPPFEGIAELTAYAGGRRVMRKDLVCYGAASWSLNHFSVTVPDIRMYDTLALGHEGIITFDLSLPGYICYYEGAGYARDSILISSNAGTLRVVPTIRKPLKVSFAKAGYVILTVTVPVLPAIGPFKGVLVDTAGTPITTRPYLYLLKPTGDTVTVVRANWDGSFDAHMKFPCDTYVVHLSGFGYYDTSYTIMLYASGGYTFTMRPIPCSRVLIKPMSPSGSPLTAEIYIVDTLGEIVAYAHRLDDITYTMGYLPTINYVVHIRSRGYEPKTITLMPTDTVTDVTVYLNRAAHDILICDVSTDSTAATAIYHDLLDAGYSVELRTLSATSFPPITDLWKYNLVIVSAGLYAFGMNYSRLSILKDFHISGGRLLFEGGDLAYQMLPAETYDPRYANEIFHIRGCPRDMPDTALDKAFALSSGLQDSVVAFYPNLLRDSLATKRFTTGDYHDIDLVIPSDDANLLYNCTDSLDQGFVVLFRDVDHHGIGRSAFITTYYKHALADTSETRKILLNLVEYLLPPRQNEGVVYGRVWMDDDLPARYTKIYMIGPIIDSTISDRYGRYRISVKAGDYAVTFHRPPCPDTTVDVTVIPDQTLKLDINWHGEGIAQQKPVAASVGMPYPNPFNNVVVIPFENPNGLPVEATVWDILGRVVITKKLEPMSSAGFIWRIGKTVPSGVYYITITIGDEKFVRKVAYIK